MTTGVADDTLVLTRQFNASPEKLFEAFTQPALLMRWFGPRRCTCPSVQIDARPGGKYRIEMHGEDSGDVNVVQGEYREVRPPDRLVFTWVWSQGEMAKMQSLVTVTLTPRGGGTELRLRHSGLTTPKAVEAHSKGWQATLECLEDYVAGASKTPVAQPTLLGDARSTYVRSARMGFAEKGIAYRLEPLPPNDPAVAEIHPFHKIPAYRQGALRLFETSAILRYLDETFAGPALQPENPVDRALMEQWISTINSYCYDAMVRRYVLQYVFPRGEGGKPDREVIDAALVEIEQQLGVLDRAYGERDTLAGDRITIADLLLAPIVFYLQAFPEGKALVAKFPNVRRAHAAIAQRPSFTATMPPLG
jgi:glutathione S-transferase